MKFTDGVMPLPLGSQASIRRDFAEYCTQIREFANISNHRLKKLWNANYTVAQIKAGQHWAEFPPPGKRPVSFERRRGPAMRWEKVIARAYRAMRAQLLRDMDQRALDLAVWEKANQAAQGLMLKISELERAQTAQRTMKPNTLQMFLPELRHWFIGLLSRGEIPRLLIPTNHLKAMGADTVPSLEYCSIQAIGRFMRSQGLFRMHSPTGNAWQFRPLQEMRERWESHNGKQTWQYQGRDWQIKA